MFYTKDKGGYKLIYLQNETNHFARVEEHSQLTEFNTYYAVRYFPFNQHTFLNVTWKRNYCNIETINALLAYINSLPFKQYVHVDITKPTHLDGELQFYLVDKGGKDLICNATYNKNKIIFIHNHVKFQDANLEKAFYEFIEKLDDSMNLGYSSYSLYNINQFVKRILKKDKK